MLTVVMGPPCSGKSTHVREHARPGDIVIDFDRLALALGGTEPHVYSDALRSVVVEARNAAIGEALLQHRKGSTVWIVDSSPPAQRMASYLRADALLVRLSADPVELHRRADLERPASWHHLIDTYRPPGEITSRPRTGVTRHGH